MRRPSRLIRAIALVTSGLVISYVLIYSTLSFCGSYRPFVFISNAYAGGFGLGTSQGF